MAKKAGKSALPKRVAGVKIPKRVRKSSVGRLLSSPMGQAIVVDSLVQAGRELIEHDGWRGADARRFTDLSGTKLKAAGKRAKRMAENGAGQAADASATLAFAIGEAARSFMEALHRGPPQQAEPHYETAWTVSDTPEPETPKPSRPPPAGRAKKKPARSSTRPAH